MIDAQKMHALACEYAQTGGESALSDAAEACLPLCSMLARRFSGRGADEDDLFQTAAMACVSALKSFDPSRGLQFSTYVTPTATGAVRNYLRDKAALLRTPRGVAERWSAFVKARQQLTSSLGREPTAREIAEAMRLDVSVILDMLAYREASAAQALDESDEDGLTVADRVGSVDIGYERFAAREDLRRAIQSLSDEERDMLTYRYGKRLTQRETAEKMGLSQMQVSRMERRALSALHKDMEGL